ncbi:hypothetical protein [Kitasatospora sp. NPDC101183]|uniref:hypothetical protein n=1 Tax=Kitasatospora sp. NPDC101183 TaxID=3364100 RepID=UPI003804A35D
MDDIHLAAAPGTRWYLGLNEVEAFLRTHLPELRLWRPRSTDSGQTYLSFSVDLDGMGRQGCYFEDGHLLLEDGDPQVWAPTLAGFLRMLPAGAQVVTLLSSDPETVLEVSPFTDERGVRELLEPLFAAL